MNYYYFISTLPMLDFQHPFFDGGVRAFDDMCRNALTAADADKLSEVNLDNPPAALNSKVQEKYILWDTNLRNAVANVAMPNGAAAKYLHREDDYFSEIDSIVQTAAAKSDPLERDKMIDQARFDKISELGSMYRFDFEFLAAYRLQLLIIEKYASLSVEQGEANFDVLIKDILETSKNKS